MSGWLSGLRVDKTVHPFSYVKTVLGTPHNPKIHHLERTYSLSLYNKVELNCCFPDGWEDKGNPPQGWVLRRRVRRFKSCSEKQFCFEKAKKKKLKRRGRTKTKLTRRGRTKTKLTRRERTKTKTKTKDPRFSVLLLLSMIDYDR